MTTPSAPAASPTFARRGLHLDFRVQVMPMEALRKVAEEAAALNFNLLLIEWEASFPFNRHAVISGELAYTRNEIVEFIGFCASLGLEVAPLQQTFGHIEYILQHERYAALREDGRDLCQLCPSRPEQALAVFGEIMEEIGALHSSPYLHIGGDETYLLGHCEACRAKAQREGRSKLYVDYFKQVAEQVVRMGKRPMVWADMLLKHPEAVREMPPECIFIDWNYGWAFDRFGDPARLHETSFELWGAPALRSSPDNHSLTCWERHFNNLRDYVPYAQQSGFSGLVLTSWSTSGVYGYAWDRETEPSTLFPIRRVYPLQGFRILLAAFAEAAEQPGDFQPEAFTLRYADERFGLGENAALLWPSLTSPVELLTSETQLDAQLANAIAACALMARLQPTRHEEEFAHLRLMLELRLHHVRFKQAERETQSPDFAEAHRGAMTRRLAHLLQESGELERRFAKLNTANLHPAELQEESAYRTAKLRRLHARLAREGRMSTS